MPEYEIQLAHVKKLIIEEIEKVIGSSSARFLLQDDSALNQVALFALAGLLKGDSMAEALAFALKTVAENYIPF